MRRRNAVSGRAMPYVYVWLTPRRCGPRRWRKPKRDGKTGSSPPKNKGDRFIFDLDSRLSIWKINLSLLPGFAASARNQNAGWDAIDTRGRKRTLRFRRAGEGPDPSPSTEGVMHESEPPCVPHPPRHEPRP